MTRRARGEGSIFRRKDGRWSGHTQDQFGKGYTVYGKTQREVREKLAAVKRDVDRGAAPITGRTTVAQYLEQWLEEAAKPRVRHSTYVSYSAIVRNHLIPRLGKVQLTKLTPPMVQLFLNEKLAAGYSPRRVQYFHAVLRRALNRALKWELVSRNVATLVDAPRVPHREIEPFTPAEARRLLDVIKGHRLEALYTTALAIGLRQGEALGLRWQDIDFDEGLVHVRHELQRINGEYQLVELKTRRSHRTIVLPRFVLAKLQEHHSRQASERLRLGPEWPDHDLVFTSDTGRPLDSKNVTRGFQSMLERVGLPKKRFHDLRHSCATLLLAQGVPARVVMEILGHSQIHLTMNTYTHVVPDLQRDAAARMDDFARQRE